LNVTIAAENIGKANGCSNRKSSTHEVQPLGPWVMSVLRDPAARMPVMRTAPATERKVDDGVKKGTRWEVVGDEGDDGTGRYL
jgi:hypothetical protein